MNGIRTAAVLAILVVIGYWLSESPKKSEPSKGATQWPLANRWPDPPPPGSPRGAIGGFGSPMATSGGAYIAPASAPDNELLRQLNQRAEQMRQQNRGRGQLPEQ